MGGNEKSTGGLNDVAMLPLRSAILSMGTGTGELRESTMRGKKSAKLMRKILPPESERRRAPRSASATRRTVHRPSGDPGLARGGRRGDGADADPEP